MSLGLTGTGMIDYVHEQAQIKKDQTTRRTETLRWLNLTQLDMMVHTWPELNVLNATFTTDGSRVYDLTSEIDSTFAKLDDLSVRIGDSNRHIYSQPKSWYDQVDPDNSAGGEPVSYSMIGRTQFLLWPNTSTGEIITLDYMQYPDDILDDDSTAITYEFDRHDLLCEGAYWRSCRKYGTENWKQKRKDWQAEALRVYQLSPSVNFKPKSVRGRW